MPQIPTYQRQGQLTTQQPAEMKSPAVAGMPWQAAAQIGETVTNTADAFRKANQVVEHTKATAEATQKIYDLRIKYENDTDYKTMGKRYSEELGKIKSDVMSRVYDPQVKGMLNLELDNDFAMEQVKISRVAKEREIDDGLASLLSATDSMIDLYGTETNPAIKEGLKQKTLALYKNAADSGLISREDFQKARISILESFDKTDAANVAKYDPQTAVKLIESNYYKNLSPDARNTILKSARENWFLQDIHANPKVAGENLKNNIYKFDVAGTEKANDIFDREVNQIQKDNEDGVVKMLVNNEQVGDDFIRQKVNTGEISANFGLGILNKDQAGPKKSPTDQILKYNALFERATKAQKAQKNWFGLFKKPFKEVSKLRADILQAANEKYLNDTEATTLLKLTTDAFNAYKPFDNSVAVIASHASLYQNDTAAANVKAEMYRQLYEQIQAGKDPDVAVADIIKEQIRADVTNAQKAVAVPPIVVRKKSNPNVVVRIPSDKFDPEIYIKI